MTMYYQEVLRIKAENYPNDDLCSQVIRAKLYIDSHFSDHIDLGKIAGRAFYSKYHFLRLFKTIYGMTPHQYLTHVRIGKAKQLLQAGIPAPEVCMAVGFDSLSSFKALFKRYTLLTPS